MKRYQIPPPRCRNVALASNTRLFGADGNDNITVAFRELGGGMNHLKVMRYEPGSGWSGPLTLLSTEDFFQQVDTAVDADGNVVVSFDPEYNSTMYTFAYDAATGSWGPMTLVSPTWAETASLATLIQDRAGANLYAVFWVSSGPGRGVYLRRFLSSSLAWAPLQRVPGTLNADLPGGIGPSSFIPATVDDAGNVTVPFYLPIRLSVQDTLWVFRAARLEAGTWTGPVTIMAHRDYEPNLVSFGDADTSAEGDVLIVFKRTRPDPRRVFLNALHYDASVGAWDPPAVIYTDENGAEQRTRVAFRADGSAVATYFDTSLPGGSSRFFDGEAWQTEPLPIPGNPALVYQEITAVGPDVIMAYSDSVDAYANWLREPTP